MTLLVQDTGDRLLPPVLSEQVEHELPDGSLLRVDEELLVLPLVSEGCLTARGLAGLGADGHRGGDPLRDLLPLPLRHRGDHGVEEATCGGRGVDGLGE